MKSQEDGMEAADPLSPMETQHCDTPGDSKLQSTKKLTYTFSTQPLETDLKKLLTQVTGKIDLSSVTEVKLKVVSGQAGLHRLSDYTPRLRILTLDGSCIYSFRDLGSSLKSLNILSVARCSMKDLDGVSGFRNLQELNARENFVSDPSPCSSVEKLSKLDLSGNQVTDVSYFAFLRSCRRLRELRVNENHFSDYREEIRGLLPQLKILDGEEFGDCLQPDVPPEEGFISNIKDLSSEDGSSTSVSIEAVDPEETKLVNDWADIEDLSSDDGSNSMENNPKILGQELEAGDPGSTEFQPQPQINDLEASDNIDKSTPNETPSGKLSSGRVICGNLAVSLRARNPTKSPPLQQQQPVPQIKEDVKFRNPEDLQEEIGVEERSSLASLIFDETNVTSTL